VIDQAASAFRPGSVDALGYASTSCAYALGGEAESRLVRDLRQRWGVPACSTGLAAVAALRSLGVGRVALVHPPWFGDGLNQLGAEYYRSQGLDVVEARLADLPEDPDLIEPAMVVGWIAEHTDDDAEAVVIGGNGFRAVGAIDELEGRLGRPVLESNQVLLWSLLTETGLPAAVRGFGTLFDR
jgi:maleate isomerase